MYDIKGCRHGDRQVIAQRAGVYFLSLSFIIIYIIGCFTGNNSVFVRMFHVEHQIFASFYFVKAVEVLGEM